MDIHLTNSIMMVKRGIYSRTLTQKIASTLGTGSLAAFITDSNVPGERTVHTPTHLTTKPFVWTRDWQRTPKKGRFAISNRIPPSLNPTKHFTELKDQREVLGRLVQCRTGHAYTGEFRRQFFLGESVNCACGEDLQTREHILRMCTSYTGHRGSLRDENHEIALPELPGTPKAIAALTAFLQDSGAFTFAGEEYTPKNTPLFKAEQEPPEKKDSDKNQ